MSLSNFEAFQSFIVQSLKTKIELKVIYLRSCGHQHILEHYRSDAV
jgi:hypothetical protein